MTDTHCQDRGPGSCPRCGDELPDRGCPACEFSGSDEQEYCAYGCPPCHCKEKEMEVTIDKTGQTSFPLDPLGIAVVVKLAEGVTLDDLCDDDRHSDLVLHLGKNGAGYRYQGLKNSEDALEEFHSTVPIYNLDNFFITVEPYYTDLGGRANVT